jgi:hypothetical protein
MIALPRINAGSDDAQATLQEFAGWSPSRRGFLTGMLAVAAVPAIPAVAATPAPGVSPRMASLIAEYERHTAALDALDAEQDFDAWGDAMHALNAPFTALVNETGKVCAD